MYKTLCVRVSQATYEKLQDLTEKYGTQTTAIAVGIDRMWLQENKIDNELLQRK
jgi:hypothetical protein